MPDGAGGFTPDPGAELDLGLPPRADPRVQRFRKKPVEVSMIRWDGSGAAFRAIAGAGGDPKRVAGPWKDGRLAIWVAKSDAVCHVLPGDWVALERDGTGVCPLTEADREAGYEPAPLPFGETGATKDCGCGPDKPCASHAETGPSEVVTLSRDDLRSNAAVWAAQQATDSLIDAGVLRDDALDPGWTLASAALEAVAAHLGLGRAEIHQDRPRRDEPYRDRSGHAEDASGEHSAGQGDGNPGTALTALADQGDAG